uniref:Rx N-terminal domain-containing protein n=1 Tax=Oryza brachyantha TaxID=4533 RepID=J3L1C7_ORYBR
MDALFSLVASDIVSRLISSLTTRYTNLSTADDKLERMQWLLLRARTIVEEAHGQQISNDQGTLLQLRQLMESMYRGYYVLNAFQEPHTCSDTTAARRLRKLEAAMEGLEATIGDLKEFAVFLLDSPRLPHRQPRNSTHLC